MSCIFVIHHTLLITLFAFSFLHYFSNFTIYIVQKGADSPISTVGAYTMYTGYARTQNNANVEKYRIPLLISGYFEIPISNTEPTLKIPKNTEKPIPTSNTDTDPSLIYTSARYAVT